MLKIRCRVSHLLKDKEDYTANVEGENENRPRKTLP